MIGCCCLFSGFVFNVGLLVVLFVIVLLLFKPWFGCFVLVCLFTVGLNLVWYLLLRCFVVVVMVVVLVLVVCFDVVCCFGLVVVC